MKEVMSLVGGLDMYAFNFGSRYKSVKSPEGRRVVFLDENGYDIQRETANRYFKQGDILTVKDIYIGRSSSEVEFIEFPNKMFNTVMFADIE
jgi:hypothetical protein